MLSRDRITGNEKACDTLDVKEELMTVTKLFKNYKAPGDGSVVKEFLTYGGDEVRNKLQKIMNIVLKRRGSTSDFRKPE